MDTQNNGPPKFFESIPWDKILEYTVTKFIFGLALGTAAVVVLFYLASLMPYQTAFLPPPGNSDPPYGLVVAGLSSQNTGYDYPLRL